MSSQVDFYDRIVIDSHTGCWLWTWSVTTNGYAQCKIKGQTVRVHRMLWVLVHGPVPKGLELRHTCHIRHCVNPAHLVLGTHKENMEDMARMGRVRNQWTGPLPQNGGLPGRHKPGC